MKERMSHEFELYLDKAGEWQWRVTHINTNITNDSSEGYKRRSAAIMNASIMLGVVFTKKTAGRRGGFKVKLNLLGKFRLTV